MATNPSEAARPLQPSVSVPGGEAYEHYLQCVSPQMQAIDAAVARVAATELPVLIAGETGTGKSMLARRVHANSRHRLAPLVVLHAVTATAQAVHALASIGRTVLIEEVGELTPLAQGSIVHLLEMPPTRFAGLRFIATTSRDVRELTERQILRPDLLHRLAIVRLDIPPLRARPDDVVLLAEHFVALATAHLGRRVRTLSPSARKRLLRHRWPGNVRELRNCIFEAVLQCPKGQVRAIDLRLPRRRRARPDAAWR